jgi:hypothetical protein
VPNFPRLRALALFGRRPPQRVEGFVMPASKNQNKRRHVFRPMISPEIAQNEGGEHVVAEREGRQLSSLL